MRRFISVISCILVLNACTGTVSTGSRCWNCYEPDVTSCREYCATWSADGRRCVRFRNYVTKQCVEELADD